VVGAALSVYLKFNLRAQTLTQLKLGDRSFIESLYAIDLVRAVNNRTLYKAFLEHPIKGNGLGSSYASYYEHLNWARIQNADILGDPPASLFFMLAGELGIVGILLFGLLSWMSLRFLFMSASGQKILLSSKQHLAYSPLALGVWSALMLSFWTGVHFIFSSVSCLIALCLAVLIQSTAGMRFLEKRVLFCATALCFAWLAVIGLSQCFAAPRVPAFRWKERGKPQVPLSVNVPLKGHAPGVWLRSGAEVYLSDGLLKLYLELPVRYYPIKLTIEAIDPSGRNFAERVIEVEANDPQKLGQYFDVQFEGYQKAGCTHPAKPSSFCSARLTVENPWIFEGSEIGVLWVDARPI